ncbi:hypothetical protein D3C80_1004440 [compost metagenome]
MKKTDNGHVHFVPQSEVIRRAALGKHIAMSGFDYVCCLIKPDPYEKARFILLEDKDGMPVSMHVSSMEYKRKRLETSLYPCVDTVMYVDEKGYEFIKNHVSAEHFAALAFTKLKRKKV